LAHKVWILDCRSCQTFFTNRGMKAVLLLRPHVPLYSTDALPANCSAYSSTSEASRPSPPPPQSGDSIRTCECLTQTLCCHGCGNIVGYMIVIPCQRCTSSMSASNRATNGHRFVFHSSEISAGERHYITGESGVLPYHPPPPSCPPPPHVHPSTGYPVHIPVSLPPIDLSASNSPPHQSQDSDSLPTPPAETNNERIFDFSVDASSRASSPPGSPTLGRSPSTSPPPLSSRAFSPLSHSQFNVPFRSPTPTLVKMRPGEVLYWHHLTKHGEIPAVNEDERARAKPHKQNGYEEMASRDGEWIQEGGIKLRGVPVLCGR